MKNKKVTEREREKAKSNFILTKYPAKIQPKKKKINENASGFFWFFQLLASVCVHITYFNPISFLGFTDHLFLCQVIFLLFFFFNVFYWLFLFFYMIMLLHGFFFNFILVFVPFCEESSWPRLLFRISSVFHFKFRIFM